MSCNRKQDSNTSTQLKIPAVHSQRSKFIFTNTLTDRPSELHNLQPGAKKCGGRLYTSQQYVKDTSFEVFYFSDFLLCSPECRREIPTEWTSWSGRPALSAWRTLILWRRQPVKTNIWSCSMWETPPVMPWQAVHEKEQLHQHGAYNPEPS